MPTLPLDNSPRCMLLTGAAGKVAQVALRGLGGRYDWRLTDCRPLPEMQEQHRWPFTLADLADLKSLIPLCQGMHTVLHLGAVSNAHADWDALLPANVIGVYNILEAAHRAGCARVILASSIMAVDGYPQGECIPADWPVRPLNLYGATKAWAEAAGRFYADQRGLSVLCLRLGWVTERRARSLLPGHRYLTAALIHEDLLRLLAAALDAPADLHFGIFHGISNNQVKRLDIAETSRVLGYAPQEDAIALAWRNWPARLRRWAGRCKRWVLGRLTTKSTKGHKENP